VADLPPSFLPKTGRRDFSTFFAVPSGGTRSRDIANPLKGKSDVLPDLGLRLTPPSRWLVGLRKVAEMEDFVLWSSILGFTPLALGLTWEILAEVRERKGIHRDE
jgi:hypothetical protein